MNSPTSPSKARLLLSTLHEDLTPGFEPVPFVRSLPATLSPSLPSNRGMMLPFAQAERQVIPYVPLTTWGFVKKYVHARMASSSYYKRRLRKNRIDQAQLKAQEKRLLQAAKLHKRREVSELWGQYVAARVQWWHGKEQTGKLYKADLTVHKPTVKRYGRLPLGGNIPPTTMTRGLLGQRSSYDDVVDAPYREVTSQRRFAHRRPRSRDETQIGRGRPGPGRGHRGPFHIPQHMTTTPFPSVLDQPRVLPLPGSVHVGDQSFQLSPRRSFLFSPSQSA